jgi:hypothetical protein
MRRGALPRLSDPALAARLIIENVALWAVHLHWDPSPQAMNEQEAEETVVRFVVNGLACKEE